MVRWLKLIQSPNHQWPYNVSHYQVNNHHSPILNRHEGRIHAFNTTNSSNLNNKNQATTNNKKTIAWYIQFNTTNPKIISAIWSYKVPLATTFQAPHSASWTNSQLLRGRAASWAIEELHGGPGDSEPAGDHHFLHRKTCLETNWLIKALAGAGVYIYI